MERTKTGRHLFLAAFLGCCLSLGLTAPLSAEPALQPPIHPLAAARAQIQPQVTCTCLYKGQRYELGELVCLKQPDGLMLAECGMMQNNTSWKVTDTPCPSVQMTPRTIWSAKI